MENIEISFIKLDTEKKNEFITEMLKHITDNVGLIGPDICILCLRAT